MDTLKIGLGQINPTVGALEDNAAKIVETAHRLAGQQASVILFPELCLSGYPPEDLVLKRHFIQDCRALLAGMADQLPRDPVIVIGAPTSGSGSELPWNAAVVYSGGRQAAEYHKMLLPNYGIFDEKRVFSAGDQPLVMQFGEARIGIHVCEDSWRRLPHGAGEGLDLQLLLNLSASPYHRGRLGEREAVLAGTAQRMNCWLAYCNLVGGQDELVFDGASMVLSPTGQLVARAKQFDEDLLCLEIPLDQHDAVIDEEREIAAQWVFIDVPEVEASTSAPDARLEAPLGDHAEVYRALVTGLRDYVNKNGFDKVVIAISGGIDSALVSAIAVDAVGAGRVCGVTMPSQYSSVETLSDAEALAGGLGIPLSTLPIKGLYDTFIAALDPHWDSVPGLAEENLQARIRGNLIMALSNKMGWLVVTTGNKSEMATGYCTLYGDMAGGFAVIKDVPKTLVFELSRWRNEQGDGEVIPDSTITRPPSAELAPDQKDTDSLPPYDVLDGILERYVERDLGLEDILADGYEEDVVRRAIRLVDLNEYKRRQAPPGVRITPKAFGRDRRIPITNRYGN